MRTVSTDDSSLTRRSAALARLLRDTRLNRGWSQQTLAEHANVSIGTVRKIESGQSPEPGFFVIGRISVALGDGLDTRQEKSSVQEAVMDLLFAEEARLTME